MTRLFSGAARCGVLLALLATGRAWAGGAGASDRDPGPYPYAGPASPTGPGVLGLRDRRPPPTLMACLPEPFAPCVTLCVFTPRPGEARELVLEASRGCAAERPAPSADVPTSKVFDELSIPLGEGWLLGDPGPHPIGLAARRAVVVPLASRSNGRCVRSQAVLVPFDPVTRRFGPAWISPVCEAGCARPIARVEPRGREAAVEVTMGTCRYRATWTGADWGAKR